MAEDGTAKVFDSFAINVLGSRQQGHGIPPGSTSVGGRSTSSSPKSIRVELGIHGRAFLNAEPVRKEGKKEQNHSHTTEDLPESRGAQCRMTKSRTRVSRASTGQWRYCQE